MPAGSTSGASGSGTTPTPWWVTFCAGGTGVTTFPRFGSLTRTQPFVDMSLIRSAPRTRNFRLLWYLFKLTHGEIVCRSGKGAAPRTPEGYPQHFSVEP